MKILFENSKIDKLDVKAENEVTIENRLSKIEQVNINSKILELRGEFFSDINIGEVTDIILDRSFRLEENKINLDNSSEEIRMIYDAGTDIYMDILNKIKIDVLKGRTKTNLNIRSKDIEILESREINKSFINIELNGGQKVKVDKSVNEINFNNEKGIELEFYNVQTLPSILNLEGGSISTLIGSSENIEEVKKISVEISNVEFICNVKFIEGVGIIENADSFIDLKDLSLKIYDEKEYEIKDL